MDRGAVLGGVLAVALAAGLVAVVGVPGVLAQEEVQPDRVVLGVSLQADGDAVWTVENRVRLATDNETAAFSDLQAAVRNDPGQYEGRFATRMERTVRTAENATGREMAVENLSVSTAQRSLPQTYGVVTYRFRWTNFAVATDGQISAGDALAGLFLDETTSLRVTWPERYATDSVRPSPDQRDQTGVTWRGPREFGPEEPAVVVVAGSPDSGLLDGLGSATRAGVVLLVLAAVLGGAFLAARYTDALETLPLVGGTAGAAEGDTEPSTEAVAESVEDAPPPELLSNEERVLALLEANDGRMKQQEVAEQLDWTAAKTSQVVSDLREDDTLETFRLGRENVVTLPDRGLGEDLGPDGEA